MRAARAAAWLVAIAAWILAAWLLLGDVVPDDLALPQVDVDAVFGRRLVDEAVRLQRFLVVDWVLSQVALLVVLWVYAKRGIGFARHSAAGRIGTGLLLGMLGIGIVWLVQLPFGLAALWWERRHDTSELGYLEWALGDWMELGFSFLAISLALLIVMALAGWLEDWWWIPGAAAFVAIAALLTFVDPFLVTTRPLHDDELVAAARTYEREQGVSEIPIRVEDVSGQTSDANAYATGLGPTRRVVLWDTILDGRFSDGAERVVLAHEIGHHSSKHLPKALAWFGLFALPAAWILMRLARRRGGMGSPAAVPLALLVVAVIELVAAPAQAAVSRRMEAEADWKALESTRDPTGAQELFVGFVATSLSNPNPPAWEQLLFGSHPTLADRVAMAEAWRKRYPELANSRIRVPG